ncbi:MAG TPA: acyl carrier protein [Dehalococcoidia bacterium]|nr:acyl carrier protein [Dehalococcoidia bacterium]
MERTKSIEQTIKGIITGIVHCNEDNLTPQTTWKDLDADSLDLVQILVALEDAFGIEISDEDAETLTNFGDMLNYIDRRQAS